LILEISGEGRNPYPSGRISSAVVEKYVQRNEIKNGYSVILTTNFFKIFDGNKRIIR